MTAIAAATSRSFSIRACPACGSEDRRSLFNLKPHEFCSVNPTYDHNFLTMLRLQEDDKFPIDRCGACDFVYARLLPDADFLKTVYEEVITSDECREHSENNASYARRMNYIASLLMMDSSKPPFKALDFGSGLGVTLRLLDSISVAGVGYDPSPTRTEAVRMNNSLVVDSLEDVAAEGPYDYVICDNVLEHVPEPKETLKFLSSVCKSGSLLFVSVPTYEEQDIQRQLRSIETGAAIDMTLNPWEHLNYFSLRHMDQMLAGSGFVPVNSTQLPGHVNIGLRPEKATTSRVKNGLASLLRLLQFMATGNGLRNVQDVYYRYAGTA